MARFYITWLLPVLFACSCAAAPADIPATSVPGIQPDSALPALPPLNTAVKRVSDTAYYELQLADIYASEGVDSSDMGFDFLGDTLSYAIFGIDPVGRIPTRLDVDAYAQDLWIAVADYNRGCWRFLRRDGLHGCGTIELSDGISPPPGMLSTDGKFYLLLVSPAGYSVGEALLRLHMKDSVGDSDPPQWGGTPGVKSVEFDEYGATVNWDAATDPSGIACYAVYVVPTAYGIDYASPLIFELSDSTSTYVMYLDEGYSYSADVIAIDNLGNATPVNTPFVFSMPDTAEENSLLAEVFPGDKVLVTWDEPALDCGLYVIGTNGDEGIPEFGTEFNGRTFISGLDSVTSGLAEEWVRIRAVPPTGVYELNICANGLTDAAPKHVQVSIVKPDGSVRQDLGSHEFIGPGSVMSFYGRLLLHPY